MPGRPPSIYAPGLFEGRVALVTGGGSGIGLAIAREFADLGAWVAICGRDEAKLAAAAEAGWLALKCDIREPEQVTTLVDRVLDAFGKIDFLINNAGGQFPAPVEKISYNGWKAVVENNLNGTFLVSKTVG